MKCVKRERLSPYNFKVEILLKLYNAMRALDKSVICKYFVLLYIEQRFRLNHTIDIQYVLFSSNL